MKYALITFGKLCQVESTTFPVAPPFFWEECSDEVYPNTHDYINGEFVLKSTSLSEAE